MPALQKGTWRIDAAASRAEIGNESAFLAFDICSVLCLFVLHSWAWIHDFASLLQGLSDVWMYKFADEIVCDKRFICP